MFKFQALTTLDLSHNPLYDESLLHVATLIKGLRNMTRLQLSSCKLTTKFFHSDRLQLTEALHGLYTVFFPHIFISLGSSVSRVLD